MSPWHGRAGQGAARAVAVLLLVHAHEPDGEGVRLSARPGPDALEGGAPQFVVVPCRRRRRLEGEVRQQLLGLRVPVLEDGLPPLGRAVGAPRVQRVAA